MAKKKRRTLVRALLETHGTTFSDELKIHVEKNTPAPLFQMLCASLLYSARISAASSTSAMKALIEAGLTTPKKMAEATWQDRVDVITWHGYKRYDERTSTMLGEMAERVLHHYGGDLRKLREAAEHDVERERTLLREFKGIGTTGASIFLREVQVAWDEVFPFVDEKVAKAAVQLGLPRDPKRLAELVGGRRDFARLAAALVRVDLEKAYDEIREAA